jgi:glycosyltransferase involved in cell wall biosynthesis
MKPGYIPKEQRKTILFMADDLRLPSGIGNMTKELILGSAHVYNYVHVAAGVDHPEAGKIFDLSAEVNKEVGIEDSSVLIYPYNGYGDPDLVRMLIERHKVDAIMHFTDPRYWVWLYHMSAELRQRIPIFYYHIWDDLPAPHYNKPYYESCDLLMGISKQSVNISHMVLGEGKYVDLDNAPTPTDIEASLPKTCYIPHGINEKYYFPIPTDNTELISFKKELFAGEEVEYALLYNNRNIRRKMASDIIMAYKLFCDKVGVEKANKTRLVLHTQVADEHGTNLQAVIDVICPELDRNIIFTGRRLSPKDMNLLYNSCDTVINIASNEGWGLSSTEAMLTGKTLINNVTGGLQDQMRFEDENGEWIKFNPDFGSNHTGKYKKHGKWAKPVFPAGINIQGSIPTPYIFDDRCDTRDVAEAIMYWYEMPVVERQKCGILGREFAISDEASFTAEKMANKYIWATEEVLKYWKPIQKHKLYSIKEHIKEYSNRKTGITLSYDK